MKKEYREILDNLISFYEDEMYEDEVVCYIRDDVEIAFREEFLTEVHESLINDSEYFELEEDEENTLEELQQLYIDNNEVDRFYDMFPNSEINKIACKELYDLFKNSGYDCYEGAFYPSKQGYFKSLNDGAVAFVKE